MKSVAYLSTYQAVVAKRIDGLPFDLVSVTGLLVLANAGLVASANLGSVQFDGSLLRAALGLLFLLFLPGYAVVAALYPQRASESTDSPTATERLALSFGISLVMVPIVTVLPMLGGGAVSLGGLLVAYDALVGTSVVVAVVRRGRLPETERLGVPLFEWLGEVRRQSFADPLSADGLLNVVLGIVVVVAVGTMGFALLQPVDGTTATDFSLLTRGADGSLVASDYPTQFVKGDGQSVVLGIGNREGIQTHYTVVTRLQRVAVDGGTATVIESQELARSSATVETGETEYVTQTLTPNLVGDDLRVVFYLYEGNVPAQVGSGTADQTLTLWISVSDVSATSTAPATDLTAPASDSTEPETASSTAGTSSSASDASAGN